MRATLRRLALPAVLMGAACVGCGEPPPLSSTSTGTGSGAETTATGGSTGGAANADGGCPQASQATVQVETDGGPFVGTLQTPAGCGPYPLVLIYPGSGPTDQNGNQVPEGLETNTYEDLAASLAENGIASVRYDKRCVGDSVCGITDEATFTFDDDVADGQLWAEQFVHDPRFSRLILAGHSEGSLWAILIAEQVPVAAVISLEGPGRPIGAVIEEQLATALATDPTLLSQADQIITSLEAGTPVASVPAALASVLGPQVQPYLISWMKYDPAKEIAKLDQPILVVQGTTDTQVDVQDANLLVAANSRAQLLLITGMCHELKDAALTQQAQTQALTDPSLPLDSTLVSGVTSFVESPGGL